MDRFWKLKKVSVWKCNLVTKLVKNVTAFKNNYNITNTTVGTAYAGALSGNGLTEQPAEKEPTGLFPTCRLSLSMPERGPLRYSCQIHNGPQVRNFMAAFSLREANHKIFWLLFPRAKRTIKFSG
jgi:hypothetical protein